MQCYGVSGIQILSSVCLFPSIYAFLLAPTLNGETNHKGRMVWLLSVLLSGMI